MALCEEFEKTGRWLFRWRSYLPVLFAGIFLLALRESEHPGRSEQWEVIWEVFCVLVSFTGLGLRALTIGYAPKGTSGRNIKEQIADTLNTTGVYSIVRNPLYLGNFFMGLGVALFAHLWWLALIYILSFWLYYERIIFAEEAFLRERFGNQFVEWAQRTPAFIPNFSIWKQPSLPFSLKNVLKREYNGLFAVVVVFFILEVVGDIFAEGKLELDPMWGSILCVTFIAWAILRTLKKKTAILKVDGR